MKSCEHVASKIHMLVEGELDSVTAEKLTQHIGQCPDCSKQREHFRHMKSYIEGHLARAVVLPDVADAIIEFPPEKTKARGRGLHVLRWAAVTLGSVVLAAYLCFHFYFSRTFPHELSGRVIRCSDGITMKRHGDEWIALKPGRRLKNGTRIIMPDGTQSFFSYPGVRVLGRNASEIEITGSLDLSVVQGEVAVAVADRRDPLKISLDSNTLIANDTTLRILRSGDSFSVDCVDGITILEISKGEEHQLVPGQRANVVGGEVRVAKADVRHPFVVFEAQVIDRIRERFNSVLAKYANRLPMMSRRTRLGRLDVHPSYGRYGAGLKFASYVEGDIMNLAWEDYARSAAEYYEELFSPSNRSLSIGRQKLVPLARGMAATHPGWSPDGSMLSYIEHSPIFADETNVKVVRLDDLKNPWEISQGYETVIPMLHGTWAPDNQHVLFLVTDNYDPMWGWRGPYEIKIAPIDPAEGPLRDFDSPFYDIPLKLPLPVGKTISPGIYNLPWGDAAVCANWGNMAYIPVEDDGQTVANAPGMFLTNFNPREVFVMGGGFTASGSTLDFTAVKDLNFNPMNAYILYDVEDILDGFAPPPRSLDDPRIKPIAPTKNAQFTSGFSFDESLAFFHEDVNHAFDARYPTDIYSSDFDLFYASALSDDSGKPTQIHLPGNQMFFGISPEGNRIVYCDYQGRKFELRIVSFDIEADIDVDLGGVLIDNSGTNLIVPPGALEENFAVKISTPFSIGEEAELTRGESAFFAMRLIDAEGVGDPRFIEPMTLTIRYTDEEVYGLDEDMLEIYYYDESDPDNPEWVPLGGTVDPDYNEITVEIQHFSKFSVGPKRLKNP